MLKQLPTTLYDSYDRILESIPELSLVAVRTALMFLAHSFRPMFVEELAEAGLIDVETNSFRLKERSEDVESVIFGLFSSLVTTVAASRSGFQPMLG